MATKKDAATLGTEFHEEVEEALNNNRLPGNEGFSAFIGEYLELLSEHTVIATGDIDLDAVIEATTDVLEFFKQQRDKG